MAPRRKLLVKIAAALVALALLGMLFVRSARDSRAQPYTVARAHLTGWTVAVESAPAGPTAAALVLRPPPALAGGLFRQVFARAMESLNSPPAPGIALLLQGEREAAMAGAGPGDADGGPAALTAALAEIARTSGLGSAPLRPRCLGYRREQAMGVTRQLFFVLFDSPEFERFRREAAALLGAGGYDPTSLSPVLFVAASDPAFNRWQPLRVDPQSDCVAPVAAN